MTRPDINELLAENDRLRRENAELRLKVLSGVIKVCSGCKSVQTPSGQWVPLDRFLELYASVSCSHGYCDNCASRILEDEASDDGGR